MAPLKQTDTHPYFRLCIIILQQLTVSVDIYVLVIDLEMLGMSTINSVSKLQLRFVWRPFLH